MILRDAIESYANAVSSRDYYEDRENTQLAASSAEALHQSKQNLDALLEVAEAALAVAEHQATSGYDPSVDAKAYMAERGKLWDAFLEARAKAKGVSNGST